MTANNTPDPDAPDTIVLIHGLWLTPLSWEHWIERYESLGYRVIAPTWPGMDASIEDLRRAPSAMAGVGITEITDHYDGIIRALDTSPIIIGHSFGGCITQLLLDRGLGSVGVALHPAPIKGVLRLPVSALRSAFPVLRNPLNLNRAVALTPKQFHYGFTNTMNAEESRAVYERYHAPGPGRVLFQAATANLNPRAATKVNFNSETRAPLVVVGGGKDHTVPASMAKEAATRQSKAKSDTEYKEYPDRSHYTLGQDGWEEVADYALEWAAANATRPGP